MKSVIYKDILSDNSIENLLSEKQSQFFYVTHPLLHKKIRITHPFSDI